MGFMGPMGIMGLDAYRSHVSHGVSLVMRPGGCRHAQTPTRYFITPISVRRFFAQAASLWPGSAGISRPKLTV